MKPTLVFAGLLGLLPFAVFAAPAHHSAAAPKKSAAAAYQCAKCHMTFTAAQAKKDHFKDPMDGGALVPVARK